MKLITISGLDGSGKSTQIQLLKEYLEAQGKKAYYFHAAQFSIANKLLRKQTEPSAESKSVTKANWLQIQLRKLALFIDLIRFHLLRNILRNKEFDYILSDRYFYDTIININYLSNKNLMPAWTSGIPSPEIAIYLSASPEIIMQRERKPDQGVGYLKKKKKLYDQNAEMFGMKTVDGNRNPQEIFEELKKLCQKTSS